MKQNEMDLNYTYDPMIMFLADNYEIYRNYFVFPDKICEKLQRVQAFCDGIKPVVYCSEAMGKLIFDMQHGDEQKKWRGFIIRMDKRLPFSFVLIYSKKPSWRTKNPMVWSEVMQFGNCSDQDTATVSRILLTNLKEGVN